MIRELPAGRGFADIVFLPLTSVSKPALVVELKYDRTARAAIQQIKDRQYIQALEDYRGEVLLVGIGCDKNKRDKPHSCVIEKYGGFLTRSQIVRFLFSTAGGQTFMRLSQETPAGY